jgi:hypothetical protein
MTAHSLARNAEHCLDAASKCTDEVQRMRFVRAAKAWRSLARSKRMVDNALFDEEQVSEAWRAAS